ncbi:hypothetical protein NDU88_006587 [Pleurodeles waltl]|uniref:Uncharacterized protein n=1 Tax=Pleurodeles waltl TaxID=8319 RepID=A0AAV7TYT9_PLEWA|nr:hypothetical protein NDU88_006587 [Pleurodeles waltl]
MPGPRSARRLLCSERIDIRGGRELGGNRAFLVCAVGREPGAISLAVEFTGTGVNTQSVWQSYDDGAFFLASQLSLLAVNQVLRRSIVCCPEGVRYIGRAM